jgi:hypothetical protein
MDELFLISDICNVNKAFPKFAVSVPDVFSFFIAVDYALDLPYYTNANEISEFLTILHLSKNKKGKSRLSSDQLIYDRLYKTGSVLGLMSNGQQALIISDFVFKLDHNDLSALECIGSHISTLLADTNHTQFLVRMHDQNKIGNEIHIFGELRLMDKYFIFRSSCNPCTLVFNNSYAGLSKSKKQRIDKDLLGGSWLEMKWQYFVESGLVCFASLELVDLKERSVIDPGVDCLEFNSERSMDFEATNDKVSGTPNINENKVTTLKELADNMVKNGNDLGHNILLALCSVLYK